MKTIVSCSPNVCSSCPEWKTLEKYFQSYFPALQIRHTQLNVKEKGGLNSHGAEEVGVDVGCEQSDRPAVQRMMVNSSLGCHLVWCNCSSIADNDGNRRVEKCSHTLHVSCIYLAFTMFNSYSLTSLITLNTCGYEEMKITLKNKTKAINIEYHSMLLLAALHCINATFVCFT